MSMSSEDIERMQRENRLSMIEKQISSRNKTNTRQTNSVTEKSDIINDLNLSYRTPKSASSHHSNSKQSTHFNHNLSKSLPKRPSSALHSRPFSSINQSARMSNKSNQEDAHYESEDYHIDQDDEDYQSSDNEILSKTKRRDSASRIERQRSTIVKLEEDIETLNQQKETYSRQVKETKRILDQEQLLNKELTEKVSSLQSELIDSKNQLKSHFATLTTVKADKDRFEAELELIKQKYDHSTRSYKNLQSLFKDEKKKREDMDKQLIEMQQQVAHMRLAAQQHKQRMDKTVKQAQTETLAATEKHDSARQDINTLLNYISIVEDYRGDGINDQVVSKVKDILNEYQSKDLFFDKLSKRPHSAHGGNLQGQQPRHLAGPKANSSTYSWETSLRPPPSMNSNNGTSSTTLKRSSSASTLINKQLSRTEDMKRRVEVSPRKSLTRDDITKMMNRQQRLHHQQQQQEETTNNNPIHRSPTSYSKISQQHVESNTFENQSSSNDASRRNSIESSGSDVGNSHNKNKKQEQQPVTKQQVHIVDVVVDQQQQTDSDVESPMDDTDSTGSANTTDLSAILSKLSSDDVARLLREVYGSQLIPDVTQHQANHSSTTTTTTTNTTAQSGASFVNNHSMTGSDGPDVMAKKRREQEVKESIRRRVETEREKYGLNHTNL
ncbi:hypothetical protein AKO1_009959 [Acrasis kona]|uniref:Cilia- and flagella-associated protein 157 n=1 Tax=Acrasis kona TaxID=1008807 RepID=A0AAW2ZR61_9EUKA